MLAFILSVVFVVLFIYVHSLSSRVDQLEQKVTALQKGTAQQAKQTQSEAEVSHTHAPLPAPSPPLTPAESELFAAHPQFSPTAQSMSTDKEPSEFFLYTWFKDEPLIKIGGLLFFLGMVWFVGYAVNQAWLPPEFQIFLAYLLALAAYGVGWMRANMANTQYIVLTCLGTGIVFAATFAAQFVYEMFAPAVALLILILGIVYTVVVSVRTQTEWLSTAAAIAGLGAPLLVNSPAPDHFLLLGYLFALAAGFLTVVLLTNWRLITMVLVVGVSLYLSSLIDLALPTLLWSFTIAFSLLFFTGITASIFRSQTVHVLDIAHLGIVGLLFVILADILAIQPGFVILVASAAVAAVAGVAYVQLCDARIIATYCATSFALALVATGHIFTNDALVIAYAIEVAAAFLLLTYLRVSERIQIVAASLYAIPFVLSAESLFGPQWEDGIPVAAAVSTAVVVGALWVTAVWLFERSRLFPTAIGTNLAVVFFVLSYLYSVILIERWSTALASGIPGATGQILTYILWSVLALVIIHYLMQRKDSVAWVKGGLFTLVIPVFSSFSSLALSRWDGIWHFDALGVYSVFAILAVLSALLLFRYLGQREAALRGPAIFLAATTLAYGCIVLFSFWNGVFGGGEKAFAALYASYALIGYSIFSFAIAWDVSWKWLRNATVLLIPPALLALLALLESSTWETIWHPHLVGLFVVTTTLVLAGVRLQLTSDTASTDASEMRTWQQILYAGALVLGIGMVWRIVHSVMPSADLAVVLALLIYTVAGLILYSTGRAQANRPLRIAGILLLALVVARLVLVDVWSMETLPRIATFLGIGFLFIVTALMEKPFAHRSDAQSVDPDQDTHE